MRLRRAAKEEPLPLDATGDRSSKRAEGRGHSTSRPCSAEEGFPVGSKKEAYSEWHHQQSQGSQAQDRRVSEMDGWLSGLTSASTEKKEELPEGFASCVTMAKQDPAGCKVISKA